MKFALIVDKIDSTYKQIPVNLGKYVVAKWKVSCLDFTLACCVLWLPMLPLKPRATNLKIVNFQQVPYCQCDILSAKNDH